MFLLASGGVDSTVAAVLLGKVLGPGRLHLLHIDNGLMRKGESSRVLGGSGRWGLGEHLHFVDASETFLETPCPGVVDPEEKRRVIGDTFVQVFQDTARDLRIEDHLLGQGTIYPDTIETGGTRSADVIKTHHNRVPIIEQMIEEGKVVEPLAELYKVEVRELGEQLGISGASSSGVTPSRGLVWVFGSSATGVKPDRTGFEDGGAPPGGGGGGASVWTRCFSRSGPWG